MATTPQLVKGIPWWLTQMMAATGVIQENSQQQALALALAQQKAPAATPPKPLPSPLPIGPAPTVQKQVQNPTVPVYSSITFLSAADTARFLQQDKDGYVSRMTRLDFVARGMAPDLYLNAIGDAARAYSQQEQSLVTQAIQKADAFFYTCIKTPIPGTTVARIPWKMALTEGRAYEYGLPHTRSDIVFLSSETLAQPLEELARRSCTRKSTSINGKTAKPYNRGSLPTVTSPLTASTNGKRIATFAVTPTLATPTICNVRNRRPSHWSRQMTWPTSKNGASARIG